MNKVTIITTPHDDERHLYLKRFLSYYEQFESPPYIVVADSSPSIVSDATIVEKLQEGHVDYKKYSHDTYFLNKLLKSIDKVTTPYAVICSEDDFITIQGISKAIQKLENNEDTVAIYGYLIAFYSNNNEISIRNAYSMHAVNDKSLINRLEYYISKFPSAVWSAIYRTEELKHILNLTLKYTNDHEFGELLPAFLTPIYGKIHSMPELFWVREYFPNSTGQNIDIYLNPRLDDFVEDSSYHHRYKRFKECMMKEICTNSELSLKEAENFIDISFNKYFIKRFGCNYKQLRRKFLLKKILKKLGIFWFIKRLKYRVKQSPKIVNQKHNYDNDPLFPKDEWEKMENFLAGSEV